MYGNFDHTLSDGFVLCMHHLFTVSASLQVSDKGPPPVSPKPKPHHISVPIIPLYVKPDVTSPRHNSLCPPVNSSRDHYHSMPDSLDMLQPKGKRNMRVSKYNMWVYDCVYLW